MMPTLCVIEFENNSKVVYSGQELRGSVRLKITSEKITVKGIFVKLSGGSYSYWAERSANGDEKKTYRGAVEYLNDRVYLAGHSDGEVRLEPGFYDYTFQTYLAPNLPTSFQGKCGYVGYKVSVVLDNPKLTEKEFEMPFTLLKAVNLNADPTLREPAIAKTLKTFYPYCLFCCWESSPLKITARTPVGGYVPGQTINLNILMDNKSGQSLSEFTVELVQEITYHAPNANSEDQYLESNVIAETESRECDTCRYKDILMNIHIPAVPPTDLSPSNLIKVQYYLTVLGKVSGFHLDAFFKMPVVIGTYPILDAPMQKLPASMSELPTTNDGTSSIQFPNDEPPIYEQFGKKTADRRFVPKYPMFKRQTSYSTNK